MTATVCDPTVRVEIEGNDADPAASVTALPTFDPSMTSCTLPLGVPAPGATAVTIAENVTACPDTEGFAELLTAVALVALPTL
jgi:hypothetical protein